MSERLLKTWQKYLSEHKISPQIWYEVMYYPHVMPLFALFLYSLFCSANNWNTYSVSSFLRFLVEEHGLALKWSVIIHYRYFWQRNFKRQQFSVKNVCSSIEEGWHPKLHRKSTIGVSACNPCRLNFPIISASMPDMCRRSCHLLKYTM